MNNKNKIKSIAMVLGIILGLSAIKLYDFQIDQREVLSNQVFDEDFPKRSQYPITLRYGVNAGPSLYWGLDPHYIWDGASIDVIDQVVESLFAYNLSHPELQPIPRLASDYGTWSGDGKTYTVPLRQGVTFHDGTPFNADDVIWNFERLRYFMNLDDSLPSGIPTTTFSSLYLWPDGITPIIETVNKINEYEVEFELNEPYAPLEALLCFSGSGMMSPIPTPQYEYIDTLTGDLVGTGPFVYDEYIEDTEVRLHAYQNYWREPSRIEILIFSIYPDTFWRTQALMDGNVDFINSLDYSLLQELRYHPDVTLLDAGTDAKTRFLVMNNELIGVKMRKAISYALDYNEIIWQLEDGEAIRLRSPIPLGIRYANWDFNVPETNIVTARQTLIDSGDYGLLPDAEADDSEWEDIAYGATPLAEYTYIYNKENIKRAMFLDILQNDLAKIGVRVVGEELSWGEMLNRIFLDRNAQHFFWLGWVPDFNDPSNIINILFNSEYDFVNFGQVHDDNVQQWMNDALSETDPVAREGIYDDIQQQLVEEVFPWCWGYVAKNYDACSYKFKGFQSNPLEKVYFYPVFPILPPVYVDIKPGSWPNPINPKSKGKIPLAICGTEDFDVLTIDPETIYITIDCLTEGVSPLRWSYEDVATPYTGDPGDGHELTGDGFLDLVLHFDTQEVVNKLKMLYHIGETIPLIIKGNLNEEEGGTPIQGEDFVRILEDKKLLTPFIIDDDDDGGGDYTWEEASKQPWCKGAGTIKKPYIIENIAISGKGSIECLVIRDSNAYFIIRDCRFYNCEIIEGQGSAALVVENAINGKIINNDCSYNDNTGISIRNSFDIEVSDNICMENTWGIILAGWEGGAENNLIERNICIKNSQSGILLWWDVENNMVNENICSENLWGITLSTNADNNVITGNICLENDLGILFSDGSDENDILGNTIKNNLVGVYFHWKLALDHCINNYIDFNDFIYNSAPWWGVPDMDWYNNNEFGPDNHIEP